MFTDGTRKKIEYPSCLQAFEAKVSMNKEKEYSSNGETMQHNKLFWSAESSANCESNSRLLNSLRFDEFEDSENSSDSERSKSCRNNSKDQKHVIGTMQFLQKNIPSHLLLVSLLEHICMLYDSDQERSKHLFQVMCQQLTAAKLLPRFAVFDEFQSIRDRYRIALTDLMEFSIGTVRQQQVDVSQLPIERSIEWRASSNASNGKRSFRTPLVRTPSRYTEEFEEIDVLGKGGFGSVYEARNKLDGRHYAVKKISLAFVKAEDCLKVLREVKVLAGLDHPNIVRYYSSWLEYGFTDNNSSEKFEDMPKEKSLSGRKRHTQFKFGTSKSNNSSYLLSEELSSASSNLIIFRSDSETHASVKDIDLFDASSKNWLNKNVNSSIERLDLCQQNLASRGNNELQLKGRFCNWPIPSIASNFLKNPKQGHKFNFRRSISSDSLRECGHILQHRQRNSREISDQFDFKALQISMHIQMELCNTTLKHWLVERNENISNPGDVIDWNTNMKIFKQLLNGVLYIHNFGLMHRDLKPRNIFVNRCNVSEDISVKIGDFGLARGDVTSRLKKNHYYSFDQFLHNENATIGIGTVIYAAPEQLEEHSYTCKADIYSLGIIFFELFSPFKTEMERLLSIRDLRQGNLSLSIKEKWPEESMFILQMTNCEPDCRPDVQIILKARFFEDKDKIIEMLRADLLQRTKQITELTKLLKENDREIQELKQRSQTAS